MIKGKSMSKNQMKRVCRDVIELEVDEEFKKIIKFKITYPSSHSHSKCPLCFLYYDADEPYTKQCKGCPYNGHKDIMGTFGCITIRKNKFETDEEYHAQRKKDYTRMLEILEEEIEKRKPTTKRIQRPSKAV